MILFRFTSFFRLCVELEFDATAGTASNVSLIFVPQMHYPSGVRIWTSDGGDVLHDKRQQTVEYTHPLPLEAGGE